MHLFPHWTMTYLWPSYIYLAYLSMMSDTAFPSNKRVAWNSSLNTGHFIIHAPVKHSWSARSMLAWIKGKFCMQETLDKWKNQTPTHLPPHNVPCSCWLLHNASLVAVRQLEEMPPQWWPCPLAILCDPGRNLKTHILGFRRLCDFFFFSNKSQHPWIKYSKLFYLVALQKFPHVCS